VRYKALEIIFWISAIAYAPYAYAQDHFIPCGESIIPLKSIPLPLEIDKRQLFEDHNGNDITTLAEATYTVKAADLNGDGVDEIFISPNFENSHNYSVWIYGEDGKQYKQLFSGAVSHAPQPLRILPSITNHYHDICTTEHWSAIEAYITIYKFNRAKYSPVECRIEKNTDERKEPEITPMKCPVYP